jgi:hypothetical protein
MDKTTGRDVHAIATVSDFAEHEGGKSQRYVTALGRYTHPVSGVACEVRGLKVGSPGFAETYATSREIVTTANSCHEARIWSGPEKFSPIGTSIMVFGALIPFFLLCFSDLTGRRRRAA